MFDLSTLSAAKLVLIYNAVTKDGPVKKFESQPRALARTLAELEAHGLTADEAARRAGMLPSARYVPEAVDAMNGETIKVARVEPAIRKVDGDPVKAARKAARAATAPLRAAREQMQAAARALAPVKAAVARPARQAPAMRDGGPARSNATLPLVRAALEAEHGATLAELTQVAGWRAPFELGNLRKACARWGVTFTHDAAAGDARRYRIAQG